MPDLNADYARLMGTGQASNPTDLNSGQAPGPVDLNAQYAKLTGPPPAPETTPHPEWTSPNIPLPDRLNNFVQANAKALRPWSDVEQDFKAYLPGLDPKALQKNYEQTAKLEGWRAGAKQQITQQDWGYWLNRRFAPFASPLIQSADDSAYASAREKFQKGEASDEDMKGMAFYERMHELNGSPLAETAMQLPRQALEMFIGGKALSALGVVGEGAVEGGLVKQGLAHFGRGAATVATQPSIWAPEYGKQRLEGATPLEAGAKTVAMAGIQAAVFGTLGKIPEAIPGSGVGQWLARTGAGTATGIAEQQAVDALASASHLDSGYGVIGDLVRGKGDQALARLSQQALGFGVFSAMHGGKAKPLEKLADTMKDMHEAGVSGEMAGQHIQDIHEQVFDALKKYPDLPLPEIRDSLHDALNGPAGDYAQSMLDGLDELDQVAKKADVARTELKGSDVPVGDREGLVADKLGLTDEQKKAWLEYPKYPLGSESERHQAAATAPTTPPASVTAPPEPQPIQTTPDAGIVDPRVHIASYKDPSRSIDNAVAMLERRGTPPRSMDTWTDPETARGQQANGTAAFVFEKGDWKGESEARQGIDKLTGAKNPLPYEPSLKEVHYKGDVTDMAYGRLKDSLDRINGERADAGLMKEYGHEGALPPVDLVATKEKPVELRQVKPGPASLEEAEEQLAQQRTSKQWLEQRKAQLRSQGFSMNAADKQAVQEAAQKEGSEQAAHADQERKLADPVKTFQDAKIRPIDLHIMREHFLNGRTYDDIRNDPEAANPRTNKPYTRARIEQLLSGAVERLGGDSDVVRELIKQNGAADLAVRQVENGAVSRDRNTGKIRPVDQNGKPIDHDAEMFDVKRKGKLDHITRLDNALDVLTDKIIRAGDNLTPQQQKEFADEFARIHSESQGGASTEGEEPPELPESSQPPPVQPPGGPGVQEPSEVPQAPPAPPPVAGPQQAAASAGPGPAGGPNPADAAPPVAPPERGPAAGGFLTSEAGSVDIDRLMQFAHDLFRKFVPEKEAPDETAEVQAAAREAAKAAGYSKAAADTAADSLIAEVNAKAHEAAFEQFANERSGPAASANDPSLNPAAAERGSAAAAELLARREAGGAGLGQFVSGEAGAVPVPVEKIAAKAREYYERLTDMFQSIRDGLDKIGGVKFPVTTRLARVVGEAMGLLDASPGYVRLTIPNLIDKVFGPKSTEADRKLAGAVVNELNLRQTKDAYRAKSLEGTNEAAQARRDSADAGARKVAARQAGDTVGANIAAQAQAEAQGLARGGAKKATEALRIANDVKTRIGATDSPLKTEQDYQAALNDPKLKAVLEAYKSEFVPLMEANFKKVKGMDEADDIRDFTQHPDYPVNMMVKESADQPTLDDPDLRPGGPGRGRLSNVQEKSLIFAKQRKGNAPNYEDDLGKVMENSLSKSDYLAKRADLDRLLVSEGLGEWGRRGQQMPGMEAFPYVTPPRGTQEAAPGQEHLYVQNDVANEYRQLLGVDKPFRVPVISDLARVPTWASLASALEAVYHGKNLITGYAKAGMNPIDFFTDGYKLLKGDSATMDRMIELARIGALKDGASFESGHLLPEARKKADPTFYLGKALDFVDKAVRLSADKAFDRVSKGDLYKKLGINIEDSETNRRDFINQIAGNYSKRSQSQLVAALRDSGISPFATAGMKYYLDGLKSFIGSTGLRTTDWKSDLMLRAETGLRVVAGFAAVGVANYLMWGRADGDDSTPIGSIKLGQTADGKTTHFPLTNLLSSLPRGARETGLLALAEGERRGQPLPLIADKAADDFWTSLMHPVFGPVGQTLYTAATGKNSLGQKVAEVPKPGGSQTYENLKAAALGMNPLVAGLSGANRPPGTQSTLGERLMEEAGPFAPKARANPVVGDFYEQYQRAQQAHQQFLQQRQRGLVVAGYGATELNQYRRLANADARMTQLNKAMRLARTDEDKARIRGLQVKVATQALGR